MARSKSEIGIKNLKFNYGTIGFRKARLLNTFSNQRLVTGPGADRGAIPIRIEQFEFGTVAFQTEY